MAHKAIREYTFLIDNVEVTKFRIKIQYETFSDNEIQSISETLSGNYIKDVTGHTIRIEFNIPRVEEDIYENLYGVYRRLVTENKSLTVRRENDNNGVDDYICIMNKPVGKRETVQYQAKPISEYESEYRIRHGLSPDEPVDLRLIEESITESKVKRIYRNFSVSFQGKGRLFIYE